MTDTGSLRERPQAGRLHLTVSSVPGSVRPAAAQARSVVAHDLEPQRLEDLETAVAEALANAIEHGPAAAVLTLEVEVLEGWVVARIREAGAGNLANGPVDLCAAPPPGPEDERGRGLRLMERLVDELRIDDDLSGRVVELRMRAADAGAAVKNRAAGHDPDEGSPRTARPTP